MPEVSKERTAFTGSLEPYLPSFVAQFQLSGIILISHAFFVLHAILYNMATHDVISSMTSLFISDSSTYASYRETRSGSGTTLLDFFFDALIFIIIIITGIIIIIHNHHFARLIWTYNKKEMKAVFFGITAGFVLG